MYDLAQMFRRMLLELDFPADLTVEAWHNRYEALNLAIDLAIEGEETCSRNCIELTLRNLTMDLRAANDIRLWL